MSEATGRGRLVGRRIAISGAASGIGQRTAELFAAEGARLLLLDRQEDGLARTAKATGAAHHVVDMTDEAAVMAAVDSGTRKLGGLDGVVTAAGIMKRGSVSDVHAAEFLRVLNVNLVGTYILVRACLAWLRHAEEATIVTLGSGQGLLPNVPDRSAYAASKGGVVNLTRALAAELAPGIRANCICPGLVDTPMADGVRANTGNYALQRLATPLEIANAILFLTSQESSYITGATLAVDGGRSFH